MWFNRVSNNRVGVVIEALVKVARINCEHSTCLVVLKD